MQVIAQIKEVRCGRAKDFARGSRSAIEKSPQRGAVAVGELGLAGDEVGDTTVHGGIDKALHCYAFEHYAYWQSILPKTAVPLQAGAFGENLSLIGLTEGQVCIGDIWQMGSAECVVSQGRQPCWKLNERFAVADMALRVQESLRCGWYLRVRQTGALQAGDQVYLLERPYPEWSIERMLAIIHQGVCDAALLRSLLDLPLPPSWQRLFSRRLQTGAVEDWQPRLFGKTV